MLIKQGKTNIKYLLIVVILAAIVGGGVLWCVMKQESKSMEESEQSIVAMKQESKPAEELEQGTIKNLLEQCNTSLKEKETLLEQREECLQSEPKLSSWEIKALKRKGLENPIEDLKNDLMNHPELIPYEGILGGTMRFFSKDMIWVLTGKWVLAYFEDGHIGGDMLLEYTVSDEGEISWKVIDSYID